MCQEINRD